MTGVIRKRRHREEGYVKMETEIGVMPRNS
jgi:hypothetical protein